MKIKWGMMMTDGRGKLGGQVASRNSFGAYVRTKVTPINPQTAFQQNVRALFGSISSAWRSLSSEQVSAWNNAVSNWTRTDVFGDVVTPTGNTLFQRLNNGLLGNVPAASILVSPPEPVPLFVVTDVSSELTFGTPDVWSVMWSTLPIAGVDEEDYIVRFRATPPMSSGQTYHKNKLRTVGVGELENDTFDMLQPYIDRFGSLPGTNQKVYVEVSVISKITGQIGVAFSTLTDFS